MVCLKKNENKWKRGQGWQIFKTQYILNDLLKVSDQAEGIRTHNTNFLI